MAKSHKRTEGRQKKKDVSDIENNLPQLNRLYNEGITEYMDRVNTLDLTKGYDAYSKVGYVPNKKLTSGDVVGDAVWSQLSLKFFKKMETMSATAAIDFAAQATKHIRCQLPPNECPEEFKGIDSILEEWYTSDDITVFRNPVHINCFPDSAFIEHQLVPAIYRVLQRYFDTRPSVSRTKEIAHHLQEKETLARGMKVTIRSAKNMLTTDKDLLPDAINEALLKLLEAGKTLSFWCDQEPVKTKNTRARGNPAYKAEHKVRQDFYKVMQSFGLKKVEIGRYFFHMMKLSKQRVTSIGSEQENMRKIANKKNPT